MTLYILRDKIRAMNKYIKAYAAFFALTIAGLLGLGFAAGIIMAIILGPQGATQATASFAFQVFANIGWLIIGYFSFKYRIKKFIEK